VDANTTANAVVDAMKTSADAVQNVIANITKTSSIKNRQQLAVFTHSLTSLFLWNMMMLDTYTPGIGSNKNNYYEKQ